MPNVLTIRETVQRAKEDGYGVSEFALRQWVKSGAIPTRKVGQKVLLYYPNFLKYIQCQDGSDNLPAPETGSAVHGIRQINL